MTYQNITSALAAAGISVYYPAAKQGICREPYVVVQQMGTFRYAASDQLAYTLLSVHCYVPIGQYETLERLMECVRDALAVLAPDLKATGNEGVYTVNDQFKAHESYIEYIIQKKR